MTPTLVELLFSTLLVIHCILVTEVLGILSQHLREHDVSLIPAVVTIIMIQDATQHTTDYLRQT